VVNIASTKMMKKVFEAASGSIVMAGLVPATTSLILRYETTQPQAWLVTALPRAACAAANRAIGTR
jgi:hypothetical protein